MRIDYAGLIQETDAELAALETRMQQQSLTIRIRMLRLLKSGEAATITRCADLLGYSTRQMHRWWKAYEYAGLAGLTEIKPRPGKPSRITTEAWNALRIEVQAGRIKQLSEAQRYLREVWGIEYSSLNGVWWLFKQKGVSLRAASG